MLDVPLLLRLAILFALLGSASAQVDVAYEVTVGDPADRRVDVEIALDGRGALGRVTLVLPDRVGFATLDEPLLEGDLGAWSPDGERLVVERSAPYRWVVDAEDASAATVRLAVPLTHRQHPAVAHRDEYEFPYLDDDHGLLVAGTLFPVVDGAAGEVTVRFQLPDGWPVLCGWDRDAEDPECLRPTDQQLVNDLLAVGHWSSHDVGAPGFDVTLAFAPGQEALEEAAVPILERIVGAELRLFGLVPVPRYLFLFGRPDIRGYGGSPKATSMTLAVSPDLPPDRAVKGLSHLVAHEFHHVWGMSLIEPADDLRFMMEGFTDYFAYLVPARLGMTSDAEFRDKLAEKLASYEGNPLAGEQSLAAAGGPAFFQGGDAYHLTYDGGLVVATWLDLALRARGQTLDDFLRDFFNVYATDARRSSRAGLAEWLEALADFADAELAREVEAWVRAPSVPDLVGLLEQVDVHVTRDERPMTLSLRGNLDGTRLLDLDPAGAAHRVGIRAGDVFLRVNGVAPTRAGQVHRAWEQPVDGRLQVEVERAGERHAIDEPVPQQTVYTLEPGPWRAALGG